MRTWVIDPGYSSFKVALVEGGRVRKVRREPTLVAEVPPPTVLTLPENFLKILTFSS